MRTTRNNTAKTALGQLSELSLCFDQQNGNRIAAIVDKLPLRLPKEGQYYLALVGKELHIFEATQGIGRYELTDSVAIGAFNVVNEGIEIETRMGTSGVGKIVLHRSPKAVPVQAITAEELVAPVGLMAEFSTLQSKANPTSADLDRKRELLKLISAGFVERYREEERLANVRRTSRSSMRQSGESASGRAYYSG